MRKFVSKFAVVILTVVLFVIFIAVCSYFLEVLLLPPDYLFYEHTPLFSLLIAPLLVIASIVASSLLVYGIQKKFFREADDFHIIWFGKKLGKWSAAIGIAWLLLLYGAFTSLTYVTPNRIVIVSPVDLQGKAYNYSDVARREIGFGNKKYSLYEHEKEGSFYYRIFLDGREVVFHMPTPNPEIDRFEDTYYELEAFDAALNKYNIPKISSAAGSEKCDFDKQYVDRFLRIIASDIQQ